MSKTQLTIELEDLIYRNYEQGRIGFYGCKEVKIGIGYDKPTEIVDYLIFDRNKMEFLAYEVKSSLKDLRSTSKLSFVGHRNYLVMPYELYEQVKDKRYIPASVGVICPGKGSVKKCSRKTLGLGQTTELMESLMRSLHREKEKLIRMNAASRSEYDYQGRYAELDARVKQLHAAERSGVPDEELRRMVRKL